MSDPSGLPDINSETYPFAVVEQLLDQAAFFNLYAAGGGTPIGAGGSRKTIGFQICACLRRLSIVIPPPTVRHGLRAFNRLGECIASVNQRWMFMPDGFAARPGVEPPECEFRPSDAQRFVMLDSVFWLEGNADGFRGFGTGRTEPTGRGGDVTGAYAVGTIVEGFGRFRGCVGTYTCCGKLTPSGFVGSVLLRVMDPDGLFQSEWLEIPAADSPVPEAGVTYLFLSGHKAGAGSKTTYLYDATGNVAGLGVEQELRLMTVDCGVASGGDIRCSSSIGPAVGTMTARINFNLLNPGAPGSTDAPIPFSSYNHYELTAPDGTGIGSFDADGGEGRTFTMSLAKAPGQQALRFGGFGPMLNGTQRFAGIVGQMTDNSVVGLFPHAIATTYVLRVFDAPGFYRSDGPWAR